MKHITDAPLAPSEITAVDPGLEAVCLRALSKAPRDRFDDARQMRAALRAALAQSTRPPEGTAPAAGGVAPTASRILTPANTSDVLKDARVGVSARRRRVFAAVAAVALVAGAVVLKSMARSAATPPRAAAAAPAAAAPPAVAASVARPSESPADTPKPVEAPAPTRRPAKRRAIPAAALPAPGPLSAPARTSVSVAPPTSAPAALSVTSPPPAPRQQPSAPRVDVEHATASITGITTTSAIPGSAIRAALARVPLVRCYREALRAGGLASATATLRLRIDSGGYVTGAALQGAGVTPALKGCLEKGATALRIKDVDTGDATADVTLGFVAAP
jgi:hypothetical protein